MPQSFSPIAIIGTGTVFPGSTDMESYFSNLLQARCFIRDIPPDLWPQHIFHAEDRDAPNASYSTLGALMTDPPFDPGSYRIPPATARLMSRTQKLALHAAGAALAEAGGLREPEARERTGVFMAAIGAGDISEALLRSVDEDLVLARLEALAEGEGSGELMRALRDQYRRAHPRFPVTADAMTGSATNLAAGRIATAFDLRGPNFVLDAACASSLAALDCAASALQNERCDFALAGGVDTWMDVHAFVQFSKVTALSAHGCFPFDDRADGFVLGEGCGLVLLQRLEDALREKRRVLAVIRGIGSSSDGADSTGITAPSTPGQLRAMRRAYEAAAVDPADLAYLECHGTGTRLGDATELESIRQLVQAGSSRSGRSLPIASVKAAVGHTRTAAGMAGLFSAMMALRQRLIPPQVNFEHPTRVFPWTDCGFHVPVKVETISTTPPIAGISGFGFGGINYHMVIDATAKAGHITPRSCTRALPLPEPTSDVAFLFPGQGSHYMGMLQPLRDLPLARRLIQEADDVVAELTGNRLSDVLETAGANDQPGADQIRLFRSTEMAQPAILLVSAILLDVVREQGIEASLAIGHSLGEYSALYAAGVLSFADVIRAVTRRGQFMSATNLGDRGAMAYILAPRKAVDGLLSETGNEVRLANLNGYEQFVVAGPTVKVNDVVAHARHAGWRSDLLAVDRAFHSPLVADAIPPLRELLHTLPLHAPRMPIPANLSGQWYPCRKSNPTAPLTPDERAHLIALMCAQLDHPVDFTRQIEAAYACGIRRFIEVGPRNVLSGIVSDMLQGKPFQVLALDQPKESPPAAARRLKAELNRPLTIPRRPPVRARRPLESSPAPAPVVATGLSLPDRVRAVVAEVTGYEPGALGDDVQLDRDLGIDSLKMIAIVSRLRGSVLPVDYRGFRELTSIHRIVEQASAVAPRQTPARAFRCYRSIEQAVTVQAAPRAPTDRYICRIGTSEALCRDVIPDLLKRIQSLPVGAGGGGARPVFQVISYGQNPLMCDRWFRALQGFLLSAAREVPEVTLTYDHLDADRPDPEWLPTDHIGSGIGIRWNRTAGPRTIALAPWADLPSDLRDLDQLLSREDLVLVSGGARGIASACVRSLVRKTQARFLLIGRKPDSESWFEQEAPGRILYVAADLADPSTLSRAGLDRHAPTLILHAAGLSPVTPLAVKTTEEVRRVLDVKALGLEHVVQAVQGHRLRGIISFSSVVAHFGNLAQQDYAAANGFLDGWRSNKNVPHLSIGWTAWRDIGMASHGTVNDIMETTGLDRLTPAEGVEWFERLLAEWLRSKREDSTVVEIFGGLGTAMDKRPASGADQPGHVTCLNTGGSTIPLFGLCGIFGHAYRLQLVARQMRGDVPFYALEPPEMNWVSAGCTSLEEMAAFYASTIEGIRPTGPIALLGTSFGGTMAYEIAKQLQARGREVPCLAVVDTMPPDEDPEEHDHLAEQIETTLKNGTDPTERDGARVARHHLHALLAHRPTGTFQGSLHYFMMTGGGWPGLADRRLRWQSLTTEGMRLWLLPGLHGGFAQAETRPHLAEGLAAMVMGETGHRFMSLARYTQAYAALSRSGDWFRPALTGPEGEWWPLRRRHGTGQLDEVLRYRGRIWLRGWARGSASGGPAQRIVIFHNNRLVHSAPVIIQRPDGRGAPTGYSAIVDVYGMNLSGGESFQVIGIGARGAWPAGSFVWRKHGPMI